MLVNYTADDKGYEKLPQNLKLLADKLPQGKVRSMPYPSGKECE